MIGLQGDILKPMSQRVHSDALFVVIIHFGSYIYLGYNIRMLPSFEFHGQQTFSLRLIY
jgi:hypothetical protein